MMKQDTAFLLKKKSLKYAVFQQLLVGLKADDLDSKQLQYIRFFTKNIPVQAVHFLHIATKLELEQMQATQKTDFFKSEYQACSKLLQKMVQDIQKNILLDSDVDVSCDLLVGNIMDKIRSAINQYEVDLLVIGSKQDVQSRHLLERELLHRTVAHLLLVPDQAKLQLKKILIPIDFSNYSIEALRMAIKISKQFDHEVQIVCLHIEAAPNNLFKYNNKIEPALLAIIKEDITDAFEYFLGNFPIEDIVNLNAAIINNGYSKSAESIMDYAKEEEVDLIILGEDRFGAIDLIRMNQLTEQLLKINDSIPTLII